MKNSTRGSVDPFIVMDVMEAARRLQGALQLLDCGERLALQHAIARVVERREHDDGRSRMRHRTQSAIHRRIGCRVMDAPQPRRQALHTVLVCVSSCCWCIILSARGFCFYTTEGLESGNARLNPRERSRYRAWWWVVRRSGGFTVDPDPDLDPDLDLPPLNIYIIYILQKITRMIVRE